jgi:uncharacterized Zn finger protein
MLDPILTDAAPLHRLANAGSFSRGEAYFARGQVRALRFDGERIVATVRGGEDYRVKLWRDDGELAWSCTCPVGESGALCKHGVATGLAWLAAGGTATADDATLPTVDDIRAWLGALDKNALVDLIVAQAHDDERLYQKLMLGAARQRQPAVVNQAVWRGALDQALGDGGFIEYREAYGVARDVRQVIDGLEGLLADGHTDAVISLAGYGLDGVAKALEQADDSSGELGGLLHRLGQLHLAACRVGSHDPEEMAHELFEREIEDQWGVISVADYAEVLGQAGLAAYRRLAEQEWAKVPVLGPGDRDPQPYGRRYHLTAIMATLADMSGDLAQRVAVISRTLSEPSAFLAMAKLYDQAGQADAALDWLERGWRVFAGKPGADRLRDVLAVAYHDRGRHVEAMALIWDGFAAGTISLSGFKHLKQHAECAGSWPDWRSRALTLIRDRLKSGRGGHPSVLVDIFLFEGDAEAAWQAASAGDCSSNRWLQLAELREASHPADALAVYRKHLPEVLPASGSGDYPSAIALIGKIKALLTILGRGAEFPPFAAELRTQHKRKRNFIALLNQNGW